VPALGASDNFCTIPHGNFYACRDLVVMEHRGVAYQVVQTASPTGWKWTVRLDSERTRTGETLSRAAAIYKAKSAINSVRPRSASDVSRE
jgi:hypothetical protein